MDITYKHRYTAKYDFDTKNITESNIREIIKRYYDFINWCENKSTAPYYVDKQYSSDGITVSFESKADCKRFIYGFEKHYIEIFLHN